MEDNHRPKRNIKQTFITLTLVLCGFMLLFSRNGRYRIFLNFINPQNKEYTNEIFADETFEKLEKKGYHIETLQTALKEEKKAKTFLNDELYIKNIDILESVRFVSNVQFVESELSFDIQDVKYTLRISTQFYSRKSYSHGAQNTDYEIIVENVNSESIQNMTHMPYDQNALDKLGEYIGVHNVYDMIDSSRKKMSYNEKEGNYSYKEEKEVSMNLREYKDEKYNVYCSISK